MKQEKVLLALRSRNGDGVQRGFEGDEENAWNIADACAAVWPAGRSIGVRPGREPGSGLALIGHLQLAGDQDHAFGGRMRVQRYFGLRRQLQENVDIRLRGIAVQHGNCTARGQEVRAAPPLQSRVCGGPRDARALLRRYLRTRASRMSAARGQQAMQAAGRLPTGTRCLARGAFMFFTPSREVTCSSRRSVPPAMRSMAGRRPRAWRPHGDFMEFSGEFKATADLCSPP